MRKIEQVDKLIIKYIIIAAALILAIRNYDHIADYLLKMWRVAWPVTFGFILSYILNILMKQYERWWFPTQREGWLHKARRPVAILLSLLTVALIFVLVTWLVVPQVVQIVTTLLNSIPILVRQVQNWVIRNEEFFPQIANLVEGWDVSSQRLIQWGLNLIYGFTGNLIDSTLATVTTTANLLFNLIISVIVAIYVLFSKEKLGNQLRRLIRSYCSHQTYERFFYVMSEAHRSFSNFISGTVIEAFILGLMVAVMMVILRLPYAFMIGVLTGVTAFVPILGAYLSGAIGAMLIFIQSPMQALIFLIGLMVVQQIEGNLIYPKVVGNSIGLPGMWVLIAVTIGGGVAGIPGMVLGVPLASTLYRLLASNVRIREKVMVDNEVDLYDPDLDISIIDDPDKVNLSQDNPLARMEAKQEAEEEIENFESKLADS